MKQVFGSSLYSFELTRSQRLQEATLELRCNPTANYVLTEDSNFCKRLLTPVLWEQGVVL